MKGFAFNRSRPIRSAIAFTVCPSSQNKRISRSSRPLTCRRFSASIMERIIRPPPYRSDKSAPFPAPNGPEQVPPLPDCVTFPAAIGVQLSIIANTQ
jgi:hypothetical protein